jgi:CCR4-NOT transcriptional complex subunit CAF120
MIQTYNPPLMDINEDTIPELQPIFTFLNSHQNKLYQEGYFLKLDDQDTRTLPCASPVITPPHYSRIGLREAVGAGSTQANVRHLVGGNPNPDRTWTECFAQLVGTVLSLWDAAELDAAGEEGEVLPKFINLTDASIKMVSQP